MRSFFSKKKPEGKSGGGAGGASSAKTAQRQELFNKYAEEGHDRIGPTGLCQMCEDMEISPEDIKLLLLAWTFSAEEQGYFSRDEWMNGMDNLGATNVPGILARLQMLESEFSGSACLRDSSFKDFYRYAFRFSRDQGQKSIDIETAKGLLALVLTGRSVHVKSFIEFLELGKLRGMNEDQWMSFLTFSVDISEDLSNFDPDGAWPSVLDDFYSWKTGAGGDEAA